MNAEILVVGQGLAGTLLARELERAGLAFQIADSGIEQVASRVAAGIINPVTGRRLVKSWRIDTLLPVARAAYREFEAALGVTLWREMRVRRLLADDRERRTFADKQARAELAPYAGVAAQGNSEGDDGFWIDGAARVDLPALLGAARERWRIQGRLRPETIDAAAEAGRHELVIDCSGMAAVRGGEFGFIPWEFSKGELLSIAVEGLAPDVILNRGHWILPVAPGAALVGATHEPGVLAPEPTAAGRAALEASARTLLNRPFQVTGQRAGIRVNLPDKHPVVGRLPGNRRLGLINGLGAKGALVAPALAQQWVRHLVDGAAFDPALDVGRWLHDPKARVASK
ncbi:MAG: FAD-binding oxidoreductase [Opitutus sp.]|nr:FAD-binding oxidoreductase [Opitutus sp.]